MIQYLYIRFRDYYCCLTNFGKYRKETVFSFFLINNFVDHIIFNLNILLDIREKHILAEIAEEWAQGDNLDKIKTGKRHQDFRKDISYPIIYFENNF